MDDVQDKQDMLFILKQLAAEELLSPEQFEQLSELEEMDLPTIAVVIKNTKAGQGLKFLPRILNDLKQQLHIYLKDLVETGQSEFLLYSKNYLNVTQFLSSDVPILRRRIIYCK